MLGFTDSFSFYRSWFERDTKTRMAGLLNVERESVFWAIIAEIEGKRHASQQGCRVRNTLPLPPPAPVDSFRQYNKSACRRWPFGRQQKFTATITTASARNLDYRRLTVSRRSACNGNLIPNVSVCDAVKLDLQFRDTVSSLASGDVLYNRIVHYNRLT